MDIYQAGAARLWGADAGGLGAEEHHSGQEAGMEARVLTEDAAALKKTIELPENYRRLPPALIQTFNQWIASWSDFCRSTSGQNIPVWSLFRQIGQSIYVKFYGAVIFNRVQEYRRRFNLIWAACSKALGQDATPIKPQDPKQPLSTSPITDFGATLVKGAVIVTGCIIGGYALINWIGRPKARPAPVATEEE